MVRGERDQAQGDLRSRFCYLPAALTKMRDTLESVQLFAHACTNPAQKRPVLGSMMELRNQEFESTPLQRRVTQTRHRSLMLLPIRSKSAECLCEIGVGSQSVMI